MCYDEEFFGESCEFEEQIEALKSALSGCIQKKYLDEMDALRKENESLRDFRDQKSAHDQELARAKAEYERKSRDAQTAASRKRLKDLLSTFSVVGFRVRADWLQGPKCERCDKNRKIHFISPSGRSMTEDCLCARKKPTYSPKEVPLVSFYVSKELGSVYYERADADRDYDRYDMCADIYEKVASSFDEINRYRAVFLKKEDCQRYCDWLNERENDAR